MRPAQTQHDESWRLLSQALDVKDGSSRSRDEQSPRRSPRGELHPTMRRLLRLLRRCSALQKKAAALWSTGNAAIHPTRRRLKGGCCAWASIGLNDSDGRAERPPPSLGAPVCAAGAVIAEPPDAVFVLPWTIPRGLR